MKNLLIVSNNNNLMFLKLILKIFIPFIWHIHILLMILIRKEENSFCVSKCLKTLNSSLNHFFVYSQRTIIPSINWKKKSIIILRAKSLQQTICEIYSSIKFRLDERSSNTNGPFTLVRSKNNSTYDFKSNTYIYLAIKHRYYYILDLINYHLITKYIRYTWALNIISIIYY